jgi:hypothetical protein
MMIFSELEVEMVMPTGPLIQKPLESQSRYSLILQMETNAILDLWPQIDMLRSILRK